EVTDAKTGKKYLERIALSLTGKPYKTQNEISELLLHITQLAGVSLPAQTAMRAIAFILEEGATNKMAETIAHHVTAAISPHIAKLQETEEKLTKTSTDLKTNAVTQDTRLEEVKSSLVKLSTQVSETASKPTYAATVVAGNHTTNSEAQTQHLKRVACEAIKECQILIDFPSNSELAAGKSSHAQLVEKVKKALATVPKGDDTPELETRSITQFRQGGMIIEMMTKEAAEYLRTNNNAKECLLRNLDSQATFKERTYTVVVPFMPIAFRMEDNAKLQQMERENGWNEGTVLTARWIKPVERRMNTQGVAHILITFTDPTTANNTIRDGIAVDQVKLWPSKNRREPMRCAKCQQFRHIAKECIAHNDTCANCGNNH
ncbi:hypothetical protein EV702DRAFT_982078, partial [Suillus placidus]